MKTVFLKKSIYFGDCHECCTNSITIPGPVHRLHSASVSAQRHCTLEARPVPRSFSSVKWAAEIAGNWRMGRGVIQCFQQRRRAPVGESIDLPARKKKNFLCQRISNAERG